jgi:hypothetical protein
MISDDLPNSIIVFSVDVNFDLTEINQSAEAFVRLGQINKNPLIFSVNGYDDDPRELWDIPEVMQYLRLWYEYVKRHGGDGLNRMEETGKAILLYAIGRAKIERKENGGANFICYGHL